MAFALEGKRGAIFGVANERSIAWHIAKICREQGARIALGYQGERLEAPVKKLGDQIDATCLQCDLTKDAEVDEFFAGVGKVFDGQLDFLVHSVAYAHREELTGRFMDTTRDGFHLSLEVSVFTLVTAARRAFPLMKAAGGGSIVTLSFFGAEKVIPHYNVMGVAKAALEASVRYLAYDLGPDNIRVNALSAGAVKTLASRAIGDFGEMLAAASNFSPLKRNVDQSEVGKAAAFLVSDFASGVTGETMYVDGGYNTIGFFDYKRPGIERG